MVFVKVEVGPPLAGDEPRMFTVRYFDEQGNLTIRSGDTRSWRCNNPGNLHKSAYSISKKRRAIGSAGDSKDEYAVYPDYETGHEALIVMLKGGIYSHLTLRAAMKRYDGSNPTYIDEIVKITGFDPERRIKSLNPKEFESFWKAIEFVEKWIVGKEDFIEKWYIAGVHKKRGIITEYLIAMKKEIWVSKMDAMKLAMEGRLHAVIVHLKNGTYYLRPEYKQKPFESVA